MTEAATEAATERHQATVGPDAYRRLMGAFPTGVAVVTTLSGGTPYGFTCTSLCSVALDPPMLLVCVSDRGRTAGPIADSGRFAVNLLHHRARPAARLFAAGEGDRFARVRWAPAGADGLPMLTDDALAFAACRVTHTVPAGDHRVIFGAVTEVRFAVPEAAPGAGATKAPPATTPPLRQRRPPPRPRRSSTASAASRPGRRRRGSEPGRRGAPRAGPPCGPARGARSCPVYQWCCRRLSC
ncbi:flavin reductase family protein [Streptomyces sp. 71268]|uniref:flavin reductase family protein n=1 Tax=Streptomyces sp. 71268 TaxID=3002640 RepID=UPI0023F702B3|nr:flavin reductase family protein [Streptomyces sp. 71268]WEV27719.1 flavin reductase family protein [Streptomyces sp. 71268]